jgi:hypothetical protein
MSALFFIDDTSIGEKNNHYFSILGGIIVEENYYNNTLQNKLREIKNLFNLTEDDPIKWSPGQTDKRYIKQKSLKNINDLRKNVLSLISSLKISIIISIIDEDALERKYDRQFYLGQAVDHLAKRFHYILSKANISNGKMILDYPGHKEESLLALKYRTIRLHRASSNVELSTLTDTLYYSHCFACDGLQLADFAVGCIGYTIKNNKYHYYNIIKNKLRTTKGFIKGSGLIVFPSNSLAIDKLC